MLPHSGRVPPIPPRSPLRPRSSPLTPPQQPTPPSPTSPDIDNDNDNDSDDNDMTLSSLNAAISSVMDSRREKPLPEPALDPEEPKGSASSPPLTKRQHALHELLSSERAYASDLALIREVHIPLALGHPVPLPNLPITPPNSSGSSSRTLSTASDSSTPSLGPPMTQEDVKIIFGNISEIAVFSDLFCQALEEALGDLLEGGKGDDHVGALFLSIIPELERPYKQYITRHPTAITHLQQLPQTPAIQNYLTQTQTIASSLSHAWDLSSLLIKPVQRLLKYPLLLTAIIDETPDNHPDKQNLRDARKQMEEVARNVNEGRRRAEVVRDVLMSKKKPVGVTVSASVNLTKMKSLRVPGTSTRSSGGSKDDKTPEEVIIVERLEKELKEIEEFAQKFAKNIVEWARMTSNVVGSLRTWALGFAKVIGLSADQGSEAFEAFLNVVECELTPLCVDLEAVINERVLKELAHLLMTMTQPLKLLASMNEQEPYHYHLMNMNVSSKNRPPPALLAASTNYLALRGQLAAELPTYIRLLHRGLKVFIYRLSGIQVEFWGKVRDKWVGLWEMLRLEEELNVGAEETVNVWLARWCEVNDVLASIPVVQDRKIHRELRSKSRDRERERERERERDRELEREWEEPEADAEYYTYHHLQGFADYHHNHHLRHSANPDTYTRSPPPPPSNSPSSPPPQSTTHSLPPDPPNSANSFATSFASPISRSGRTTERGDRGDRGDRSKDKDHKEREKKKAPAQATNVKSILGALEPVILVAAGPYIAPPPPPLSPRNNASKADSPGTRGRGNSDVSSYGSASLMPSVGLGLGGTGVFPGSGVSGGGGGGKKSVGRKGSNESLRSKETVRSPPPPIVPGSSQGHTQVINQPQPLLPQPQHVHPTRPTPLHPQRKKTTEGIEPAQEDLREYEAMIMREKERFRERVYTPHGRKGYDRGNRYAHPHPSQHGRGLPRTKSMPLPYHPRTRPQARRQSQSQVQKQAQDQARRGAGEWSEYVDEEDSELFYQPPSDQLQVQEYAECERDDCEHRPARLTEVKDTSRKRDAPKSNHSRQQSVGKDEERRRNSGHSTYSSKSRDEKREKDKDKSSSHKRSGSIKSITSFFSWNRDSHVDSSSSTLVQSGEYMHTSSPRDSWTIKPAKYTCRVIHPCKPPKAGSAPLSYFSFPFFTLEEGELYEVLQEAGHPSLHPDLPLIVDEGAEDCLLLCRAWDGDVGWALASFLEPDES